MDVRSVGSVGVSSVDPGLTQSCHVMHEIAGALLPPGNLGGAPPVQACAMFSSAQVAPVRACAVFSSAQLAPARACAVFSSAQMVPGHTCAVFSSAQVAPVHACAVFSSAQVT